MATRVRKLARELRRSPAEVLGLLHELGYVRYRSTEDQISDVAVERVREAARQGLSAKPVQPVAKPRPETADVKGNADDWMGKLVPGIVRRQVDDKELGPGQKRQRPAKRSAPPEPEVPAADAGTGPSDPTGSPPRTSSDVRVESERSRLEAERVALEADRAELAAARAQLERARKELAEARMQVEQLRYDLEQERIALAEDQARPVAGAVSLAEVLEARGLRGLDEQQRALAALAAGRHLGAVLSELRLRDPARVRRILEDRLVLVAGEIPAGLQGVAAITVAPDRAELPDSREIERMLHDVGEQLLLNGLRRLVVVNAAPRWQRLIRDGVDRRVEVAFRPVPDGDADPGLSRVDAVVLWRIELPESQRKRWAEEAGRLIFVPEAGFGAFLSRLRDRLRGA